MNNKPVFEQLESKYTSTNALDREKYKEPPKPVEVFHTEGYPFWRRSQIAKNKKAKKYDELFLKLLEGKI